MKNPHAMALGRLGGQKGGPARAKVLSAERRLEIAQKASRARWAKSRSKEPKELQQTPDDQVQVDLQRLAEDRVYRRDLANKFSQGTAVDPGDLEHVLYNLTLSPMERLTRSLS
jgi:hypothetical protein